VCGARSLSLAGALWAVARSSVIAVDCRFSHSVAASHGAITIEGGSSLDGVDLVFEANF
jgi:hypothetical protein